MHASPVIRDLVLVGGGHSHAILLRRFGMNPLPGLRITLISREIHTPYSGMLPGLIAGFYTFDEAHIDLAPLTRFAGARLYNDEVAGLDLERRLVLLRSRPPVPYDLLSINVGSSPKTAEVLGAREHATPVKPIHNFLPRWHRVVERALGSPTRSRIGVVGAGAGGVELILAAQAALERAFEKAGRRGESPELHLVAASAEVLPTYPPAVRRRLERILRARRIQTHLGQPVVEVNARSVRLAGGSELALDETLWATAASAAPWLAASGLDVDALGFVRVRPTLQSTSHPEVFAAGDIAAVEGHPREKAGVFAVRQGRPLEENIRRVFESRPLVPFIPQRKYLSLIGTGDGRAVASRGVWSCEGRLVWKVKDWIDRRFMRKFSELPDMGAEAPEEGGTAREAAGRTAIAAELQKMAERKMRCSGCGAKVGATSLHRVLERLSPRTRADVVVGLDAPDDAAVSSVPPGKLLVQTVDEFPALIDDPYIFGKIASNHALGDVFAMGAEPWTALAMATLPWGPDEKMEAMLEDLLRGSLEVLEAAGAVLVGGHTTEGTRLVFGLAVSGLVDPERVLRKGGLLPGQILVLTKPLGTGALFAAEMRQKARGRWLVGAIESMLRSNRDAARILARHGATACTDVTGFGLVGHLVEMLRASAVSARLQANDVPLLEGALETASAGIHSSLFPQNARALRSAHVDDDLAREPRLALLADPQTSGGLLAGIPAADVDACLAELRRAGYAPAAAIGVVEARSSEGELIRIERAAPAAARR